MSKETEKKSDKQIRWTTEQGRQLVEGWRRSGESIAAYCRRLDVDPSRLRYWREIVERSAGEERGSARTPVSFLPVVVRAASAGRVQAPKKLELVSPEWAARFVRELLRGEQ